MPLVSKFIVPLSSGVVDFIAFFPGKNVKVDAKFRELIEFTRGQYVSVPLECEVCNAPGLQAVDDIRFGRSEPSPNQICAILAYLGGEGSSVLDIPEGEGEINLILAYTTNSVIFIEHEFEHGKEEIHLHARGFNQWNGDDNPLVLFVGEK